LNIYKNQDKMLTKKPIIYIDISYEYLRRE